MSLPEGVHIATMTLHVKLTDTDIHFDEVIKRLTPHADDIVQMEYNNILRSIPGIDRFGIKKRNKTKSNFHNSMSVYVVSDIDNNRCMHVNLFKNGTMHITGAKHMNDAKSVTCKLVSRLAMDPLTHSGTLHVQDMKVNMINANIEVDFTLNKKLLRKQLQIEGVECIFNKTQNITIKHELSSERSVIIIIHKNSVILSRCKSNEDIVHAHRYVHDLLNRLKPEIFNISIDDVVKENSVLKSCLL